MIGIVIKLIKKKVIIKYLSYYKYNITPIEYFPSESSLEEKKVKGLLLKSFKIYYLFVFSLICF
jgi:hypothetical protein